MIVERTYYGEDNQRHGFDADEFYSPDATPYFTLVMIDGHFFMERGWCDGDTKQEICKESFAEKKYWDRWEKNVIKPDLPHPKILIRWIREFNEYCETHHSEQFNSFHKPW